MSLLPRYTLRVPDDPNAAPSLLVAQAATAILEMKLLQSCVSQLQEYIPNSLRGPMEAFSRGLEVKISYLLPLRWIKDSQDGNEDPQGNLTTSYFFLTL